MLKKKLEGFTLVEMIIALAVFMVMALVLAVAVQFTTKMTLQGDFAVKKVNAQAFSAIDTAAAYPADTHTDTHTIKFTVAGNVIDVDVEAAEIEGDATTNDKFGDSYVDAPNLKAFKY